MASQSRTQICKRVFFLSLRRQATQTVCDENKDDKGRQRTKVWMAWLIASCHDILFPPLMSAPSTGGQEQRPCCWCDQKDEANVYLPSTADSFTPRPHTAPGISPHSHQSAVKAISAHITITACYKTENTVPNDCQLEKGPAAQL